MAKYVEIEPDELRKFLTNLGFKRVKVKGCREEVFGKTHRKFCRKDSPKVLRTCIRVYTTIEGGQRDVGKDAIRVHVFGQWYQVPEGSPLKTAEPTGEPFPIHGFKRVHRVAGWRKNLQDRIQQALTSTVMPCKCGGVMVQRKGRKGAFLGCSNYPECRETRNVEGS